MSIRYLAASGNTIVPEFNELEIVGSISATTYYGIGSFLTGIAGGAPINVTYNELYDLVVSENLAPSSVYRLTDYRSYNFIHGYSNAQNNSNSNNINAGRLYKSFSDTVVENGLFNNNIFSVGINDDNSLIVGGEFTSLGGVAKNYLIKLNSGGTEDETFYSNLGGGFDFTVYSIAIQSDGKILVGGGFVNFSGNSRNYLVRLNSDGTEDIDFYNNLISSGNNSGLDNAVRDIKIQSDGKILIGGYFGGLNGNARTSIVRLNSDGTEDTTFYSNFSSTGDNSGLNGILFSVGYDSNDGSVYLGGNFSFYNGSPLNRILKLDSNGLRDETFMINIGSGFNGDITTIDVQSDQKILIGGSFIDFNGSTRRNLLRLNNDGTEDTTFYSNLVSFGNNYGFNGTLFTVKQLPDTSIAVGGQFTALNGQNNYYFVKLNSDGTYDTNFKTYNGFQQQVRYVNSIDNDYIIVAGDLTYFQDIQVNKIIKLYNVSSDSGYVAREIYTGDTEVLLLKSISNSQFDPVVLSETYPSDILEYLPFCNNLGFELELYNGVELPDSSYLGNFDLQWDGENVYFDMPLDYNAQFGHFFYVYAEIGNKEIDFLCEPLTPIISTVQYNYSSTLNITKIEINSGGTRVVLPELTYQNYLDYQADSLDVQTIYPIHELRGWVTRRTDKFRNISMPSDFRGMKYRRYQMNLNDLFETTNYGFDYIGLSDSLYYNGYTYTTGNYGDSAILGRIDDDSYNVQIEGIGSPDGNWWYNGSFDNNLFVRGIFNSSIKDYFYNNTFLYQSVYNSQIDYNFHNNIIIQELSRCYIGDGFSQNIIKSFYDNKIDKGFYHNRLDNGFANNKIGINFENNTIGNSFSDNIIGSYFYQNNIKDFFQYNVIGNGFNYNSVFSYFNNNQIGDYFQYNSIHSVFRKNLILNDFNGNTISEINNIGDYYFENNEIINNFKGNDIKNNFWSNRLKTDFKANIIFQEFGYNNIGFGCFANTFSGYTVHNEIMDYCQFNTMYGSFANNKIGSDFYSNEIEDGFGYGGGSYQGNVIGNNFYDNTIGEYFYNNKISDNFFSNLIENGFNSNTIPYNFYSNTVGNSFQWNNFQIETWGRHFLSCVLYEPTTVNVILNRDGNTRLTYYDEFDVLNVEPINENICLSFTIYSSDFAHGNPIYINTTALGVNGIDGFENTASENWLGEGYFGNGLSGTSLLQLTDAYNLLGFNLNNSTGYLWNVTWGAGSSIPTGVVKFGANIELGYFDIQAIDTSDLNYQNPNNNQGTSLVGTFLFPATFTIYYPIINKSGWC